MGDTRRHPKLGFAPPLPRSVARHPMGDQPTVAADLEYFLSRHGSHGPLHPTFGLPTPNGRRLEIACPCGITFERWMISEEMSVDQVLQRLSRLAQ
jgi:hypothetical protein